MMKLVKSTWYLFLLVKKVIECVLYCVSSLLNCLNLGSGDVLSCLELPLHGTLDCLDLGLDNSLQEVNARLGGLQLEMLGVLDQGGKVFPFLLGVCLESSFSLLIPLQGEVLEVCSLGHQIINEGLDDVSRDKQISLGKVHSFSCNRKRFYIKRRLNLVM